MNGHPGHRVILVKMLAGNNRRHLNRVSNATTTDQTLERCRIAGEIECKVAGFMG